MILTPLLLQLVSASPINQRWWPTNTCSSDGNNPSLAVPESVPGGASMPVDPSFTGFAFEQASMPEYAKSESTGFQADALSAVLATRASSSHLV